MALRSKFFLYFFFIAGLPLIFLGWTTFSQASLQVEKLAVNHLISVADISKARINEILEQYLADVRFITSRTQLRSLLKEYNSSGDTTTIVGMKKILDDALKSSDDIESITLRNTKGDFIVSTDTALSPASVAEPSFVSRSLENANIYDIFKNDSGVILLRLGGPLRLDDTLLGIADITLKTNKIFAITSDYLGLGESGEIAIAKKDANGDALYITPLRFDPTASLRRVISKEKTNVPIVQTFNSKEGVFSGENEVDYRGVSIVAATRFIDSVGWGVVAKIDRQEVFSSVSLLRENYFFTGFLMLFFVLAGAFIFSRELTKPLHRLIGSTLKLQKGDFSERVHVRTGDEIGILAHTFNTMAGKLQELYVGLEQKVKDRTVQLTESKERLDLVLNSAKMGAWDLDLIHDTAVRNLWHDQIFGYTTLQPKWGVKIFGEHVIPEDRAHANQCFEESFKTGNFFMQCRIRWADKTMHWIEARGHVYYDEKKKPVRMLGTVTDITEKKNAENFILESKAKDEAILTSMGDGLIVTDVEGRIILANQAVEQLLGWRAKDLQGKKFTTALPMLDEKGEMILEEKRPVTKTLREKIIFTTTVSAVQYRKKDGTSLPVAVTVSPIMLGGKMLGAVTVFRDVTKEKAVDLAKTEFVSLASHQLRTPLSAIKWYTEMLTAGDAGKLNTNQKKYLQEVYKSNERMIELVGALLNVSRLELGTLAIEPTPTDLVGVIVSVLDELRPQIKEKHLVVKTGDTAILVIDIDQKLFRMVVQNLLSNAIKYTPEKGKIDIVLSKIGVGQVFGNKKLNKESIGMSVSDTGYGIPQFQQAQIFKKLFRADNVREKDAEGTGLGLYIVKSIIQNFGGDIWFVSEENHGTVFYVTMPMEGIQRKEGTKTLV